LSQPTGTVNQTARRFTLVIWGERRAVAATAIPVKSNPIAAVKLLRKPNVDATMNSL